MKSGCISHMSMQSTDIKWHPKGDGKWQAELSEHQDLRNSISKLRGRFAAQHPGNSGLILARRVTNLCGGVSLVRDSSTSSCLFLVAPGQQPEDTYLFKVVYGDANREVTMNLPLSYPAQQLIDDVVQQVFVYSYSCPTSDRLHLAAQRIRRSRAPSLSTLRWIGSFSNVKHFRRLTALMPSKFVTGTPASATLAMYRARRSRACRSFAILLSLGAIMCNSFRFCCVWCHIQRCRLRFAVQQMTTPLTWKIQPISLRSRTYQLAVCPILAELGTIELFNLIRVAFGQYSQSL